MAGNGSKSLGNEESDIGGNFGLLSLELEKEFRGLQEIWTDQKVDEDRLALLENQRCVDNHDLSVTHKEYAFRKRKRDPLAVMFNWLTDLGKCVDPSTGGTTEPSELKNLMLLARATRNVLMIRRDVDSNIGEPILQNKPKIYRPPMYDDPPAERLKCSERVIGRKRELKNGQKKKTHVAARKASDSFPSKKHVPVGPRFQASVPEWTGVVVESDSKWLGTLVWPSVDEEPNSLIERDFISRGRSVSCGCPLPGSVTCVRFHTTENRMKLKLELGPVFFSLKFSQMGEEVSLRWTIEEEKRFKDVIKAKKIEEEKRLLNVIKSNRPPSEEEEEEKVPFWDKASKYFPGKTRKDLVSYYFNVFVIRLRSYQNRVTPKYINSDDEGSDFGYFSESFGHEAVTIPGSDMLTCSENTHCTDFE